MPTTVPSPSHVHQTAWRLAILCLFHVLFKLVALCGRTAFANIVEHLQCLCYIWNSLSNCVALAGFGLHYCWKSLNVKVDLDMRVRISLKLSLLGLYNVDTFIDVLYLSNSRKTSVVLFLSIEKYHLFAWKWYINVKTLWFCSHNSPETLRHCDVMLSGTQFSASAQIWLCLFCETLNKSFNFYS